MSSLLRFLIFGFGVKVSIASKFVLLNKFVNNYYKDLVKHFDFEKYEKTLEINFQTLSCFMEIIRRTWIWFIEKIFGIKYEPNNIAFKDFIDSYDKNILIHNGS